MKASKKGNGYPIAKRKTFQNTIKSEKDKIAEIKRRDLEGWKQKELIKPIQERLDKLQEEKDAFEKERLQQRRNIESTRPTPTFKAGGKLKAVKKKLSVRRSTTMGVKFPMKMTRRKRKGTVVVSLLTLLLTSMLLAVASLLWVAVKMVILEPVKRKLSRRRSSIRLRELYPEVGLLGPSQRKKRSVFRTQLEMSETPDTSNSL